MTTPRSSNSNDLGQRFKGQTDKAEAQSLKYAYEHRSEVVQAKDGTQMIDFHRWRNLKV